MKSNKELKQHAKNMLKGNWKKAVVVSIMYILFPVFTSPPSNSDWDYSQRNFFDNDSIPFMNGYMRDDFPPRKKGPDSKFWSWNWDSKSNKSGEIQSCGFTEEDKCPINQGIDNIQEDRMDEMMSEDGYERYMNDDYGYRMMESYMPRMYGSMKHPLLNILFLLSILFSGQISIGIAFFFLNLARGGTLKETQIFAGFKKEYLVRGLVTNVLLILLYILWFVLLIVPGIVALLKYALTYFILIDDKNIEPLDAIKKSKDMMYGHKAKLFRLALSFFGWIILSILTCGIGFIWLVPYIKTSLANFYEDLKIQTPVSSLGGTQDTNADTVRIA